VVVNGIGSGLAAPAAIGVPLTYRDCAQGVIFVTGHGKTETSQPDWSLLAQLDLTLVIYMGISRCAPVRQALIDGGKAPETPVAVIHSVTSVRQVHLLTTLDGMTQAIAASGIGSPSIIVIGDVVRFADVDLTKHFSMPQLPLQSRSA
jgi:uroporphyrin-III C-methyltransferase